MNRDKQNATIQLYATLLEEAAFGIFDLEGLKQEVLKWKEYGAEIFWKPRTIGGNRICKSNLDVVVMCENPEFLQFVIEEFVVKENLNINMFNGDGETALDQAYKIVFGKKKEEIVKLLRGYGAKTAREIFEEQVLKNAKDKKEQLFNNDAQKAKTSKSIKNK